jgi:hypothetical protein
MQDARSAEWHNVALGLVASVALVAMELGKESNDGMLEFWIRPCHNDSITPSHRCIVHRGRAWLHRLLRSRCPAVSSSQLCCIADCCIAALLPAIVIHIQSSSLLSLLPLFALPRLS